MNFLTLFLKSLRFVAPGGQSVHESTWSHYATRNHASDEKNLVHNDRASMPATECVIENLVWNKRKFEKKNMRNLSFFSINKFIFMNIGTCLLWWPVLFMVCDVVRSVFQNLDKILWQISPQNSYKSFYK